MRHPVLSAPPARGPENHSAARNLSPQLADIHGMPPHVGTDAHNPTLVNAARKLDRSSKEAQVPAPSERLRRFAVPPQSIRPVSLPRQKSRYRSELHTLRRQSHTPSRAEKRPESHARWRRTLVRRDRRGAAEGSGMKANPHYCEIAASEAQTRAGAFGSARGLATVAPRLAHVRSRGNGLACRPRLPRTWHARWNRATRSKKGPPRQRRAGQEGGVRCY